MNIDLTAIFDAHGIRKVERYKGLGQFSVVLADGRCGAGKTVGEALANAKQPTAENIDRIAA